MEKRVVARRATTLFSPIHDNHYQTNYSYMKTEVYIVHLVYEAESGNKCHFMFQVTNLLDRLIDNKPFAKLFCGMIIDLKKCISNLYRELLLLHWYV